MRHEVVMPHVRQWYNTFLSEPRVFHFKHASMLRVCVCWVCVWCVVVAAFERRQTSPHIQGIYMCVCIDGWIDWSWLGSQGRLPAAYQSQSRSQSISLSPSQLPSLNGDKSIDAAREPGGRRRTGVGSQSEGSLYGDAGDACTTGLRIWDWYTDWHGGCTRAGGGAGGERRRAVASFFLTDARAACV